MPRILLADDEPFNMMALEGIIKMIMNDRSSLIQIDKVYNGFDAVKKVNELYNQGHNYDIIMLDFHMPVLDGVSAAEKIREITPQSKLVLSTGDELIGQEIK